MKTIAIQRHKAAIRRTGLSKPVRLAMEDGLLSENETFFDYGCGHGDDLRILEKMGMKAGGWDPALRPDADRHSADIVNLGYVINVIEDPEERTSILREAWDLANEALVISARLNREGKGSEFEPYGDGVVTALGTFQKFYDQSELREWIDGVLGVSSVAVAPGIFYVFRSDERQSSFLASRQRRRIALPRLRRSEVLFEEHQDLLRPLMDFVADRGRLPDSSEIEVSSRLREVFGSVPRAFRVVIRVTGEERWEEIKEDRSRDFLVYLALSKFTRRPKFSQLPDDIRRDVKALFKRYRTACDLADLLLYSAGDRELLEDAVTGSSLGKVTPRALYIHVSALPLLPPLLRVYEGCARSYIGEVEGANVIKLHRLKPAISYMSYPDFDRDPHPSLAHSTRIELDTFHLKMRGFEEDEDPPVLHRKNELVSDEYPSHAKFARLTKQEDRKGLHGDPGLATTKISWLRLLEAKGLELAGHRLRKRTGVGVTNTPD